jgi:hypothetical protein
MKEFQEPIDRAEPVDRAIEDIFKGYEETAELRDFKDEIAANLSASVQSMTTKGIEEKEALRRALDKLGDITEVADRVSRQKRREIIGGAFVRPVPLDRGHVIGYPAAGLVLAFGIVVSAITGLSAGLMESAASLMPFALLSLCALVFLGLTQETKTRYPLGWKRSLLYMAAAGLICLGLFTGVIVFFDKNLIRPEVLNSDPVYENINAISALGTLIPFVLSGAALLAFLILSERDRKKPWVHRLEETQNRPYDTRFGLLSGALWIFAAALFFILTRAVGIGYSWVTFILAVAVQLLVKSGLGKRSG